MNKTLALVGAAAVSLCLSGAAFADTLIIGSSPGSSDTFTNTSITFSGLGSAGPGNTGIFAGVAACAGCVTLTSFTSTTPIPSGGLEVFSVTSAGVTADIFLNSFVFTPQALAGGGSGLDITGTGFALLTGSAVHNPITFALSTQLSSGQSFPTSFSASINTVPLPGALLLFGSGLVGLTALGRRRQKRQPEAAIA